MHTHIYTHARDHRIGIVSLTPNHSFMWFVGARMNGNLKVKIHWKRKDTRDYPFRVVAVVVVLRCYDVFAVHTKAQITNEISKQMTMYASLHVYEANTYTHTHKSRIIHLTTYDGAATECDFSCSRFRWTNCASYYYYYYLMQHRHHSWWQNHNKINRMTEHADKPNENVREMKRENKDEMNEF